MRRIDKATVQLTAKEHLANVAFNRLLDRGLGIHEAARIVKQDHPALDPAFYRWLVK